MAVHLSAFLNTLRGIFCLGTTSSNDDSKDKTEYIPEKALPEVPRIDYTSRLPSSTLSTIFLDHLSVCLHPSSPFLELHSTAPPMIISQVNRRWRKVATQETPELWSTIRVGNRSSRQIIELWIKRSVAGNGKLEVPLDIRIDGIHTPEDLKGEDYTPPYITHSSPRTERLYRTTRLGAAWILLRSQFRRWRRVEMTLDVQSALYFVELPLIWMKENLESLSIQVVAEDRYEVHSPILDSLYGYLDQEKIKLKWESTRLVVVVKHPLWGSLRRIHLTVGLTMDESVDFLKRCVMAEEVELGCITDNFLGDGLADRSHSAAFSFSYGDDFGFGAANMNRHRLPNLRSLSIGFDGSACDCTLIIQFFTLPALRKLRLMNFGTRIASCMRVVDLLRRSGFDARIENQDCRWAFERLSLVDYDMPESVLLGWLTAPGLGKGGAPAITYYTRRTVRLEFLIPSLDIIEGLGGGAGGTKDLEYYQDAKGGTWIGRNGLPGTYLVY